MAKQAQAVQQNLPLPRTGNAVQVSDEEMDFLREHKGEGISTAAEDNFVPLVNVLQSGSRQVINGPAHVDGAKAGSFLLRNAPQPLVDGEEGFVFQPCYFYKDFAEWVPRDSGGGLVGMHREIPADAKEVKDARNPNKVKWITPRGNEILERRNHLGFVINQEGQSWAYAIPFTSTGHSVSRNWMTTMQNRTLNGIVPPSYCFLYRIKTRMRSNSLGNWYVMDIQPETSFPGLAASGMVNSDLRNKGKAFFEACKAGDKLAEAMTEKEGDDGAEGAM